MVPFLHPERGALQALASFGEAPWVLRSPHGALQQGSVPAAGWRRAVPQKEAPRAAERSERRPGGRAEEPVLKELALRVAEHSRRGRLMSSAWMGLVGEQAA